MIDYKRSAAIATERGFKAFYDVRGYKGVSFRKNSLKWIHDDDALCYELGCTTSDLIKLGYDLESYYKYNAPSYIVPAKWRKKLNIKLDKSDLIF